MRRMDRYNEESVKFSRAEKNQELYHDVVNNPKYTNITDVRNANAYEIDSNHMTQEKSRETYQRMRRYQGVENVPKVKKELDDFNYLYPKNEKKIYDINSVLEEARKNRKEPDQLEEKRKLKYTSYNILAGINLEELKKYREEKKKRQATPEEEGIHELMDTIASKTLAGELDKETTVDLLSDLMATNMFDKVDAPQDIDKKAEEKQDDVSEKTDVVVQEGNLVEEVAKKKDSVVEDTSKVDKDFYTKSMDLSEEDFEMSDDFSEKRMPVFLKLIIVFAILVLVLIAAYYIYQKLI